MSWFDDFEDCMPFTVTCHQYTGRTQGGDAKTPIDVTYKAYIMERNTKVTNADGNEVISRTQIYPLTTDKIHVRSKWTLPVEFQRRNKIPSINVGRFADDDGTMNPVVFL